MVFEKLEDKLELCGEFYLFEETYNAVDKFCTLE